MMGEKYVLILGAGPEQLPIFHLCKKKKLKIVSVDRNKLAPGLKLADKYIVTSIRNDKKLINKLKKLKCKIIAVLTIANDVPLINYKIAKAFNLKKPSLISSKLSSNKKLFYNYFKNYLNLPKSIFFKKIENLSIIKKKFKFPIIMKPIDGRGARGTFLLNKIEDLKKYFSKSMENSEKKEVIIQEFISGPQISTESFIFKKKTHTLLSNRNYSDTKMMYPFIIENGGNHPANLSKKVKKKIYNHIQKIRKGYNLNNGPLKCDLVLNKNRIYTLEASPRFGGGYVASHISEFLYGSNFLELYLDYLIGKNLKIKFEFKNLFVSIRFIFNNKEGILKSIDNKKIKQFQKFVILEKFFKKKGQKIKKIESHADRIGYVAVSHKNLKDSKNIANLISKNYRLKMK